MKKTRLTAIDTPESRTPAARSAYSSSSVAGRPKRRTSSAPPTLKRSVIRACMSALSAICVRVSAERRAPMKRAGTRKIGTSSSASSVICQLIENSATRMSASCTRLETKPDRIEVKAVCAPMTSLLSRETRAPVCARVKKAIGWRSTCAKTSRRRL